MSTHETEDDRATSAGLLRFALRGAPVTAGPLPASGPEKINF